jgi:hypothetical protein
MSDWQTLAHVVVDPLPADWRHRLAQRLGRRPRRIGAWGELALYGARLCLDAAGEATLPAGALLRVASLRGPLAITRAIAEQARSSLPLPFAFMQGQPSHMLAALSRHLAWQGDARFMLCRDKGAVLRLATLESGPAGVLIGWVEEDQRVEWWRGVHSRSSNLEEMDRNRSICRAALR